MTLIYIIDINHLNDILGLLKRHQYSGTNYYDLGLRLGLSPRTLDVIGEDHTRDVNGCLRGCLKAWLQQADNVKSKGGPTHYSLIRALKDIELRTIADAIDKEGKTCIFVTK